MIAVKFTIELEIGLFFLCSLLCHYCSTDHSATLAQGTSCNACVTRTERFGRLG